MPNTWSYIYESEKINLDDLLNAANAKFHHTSTFSGYVSRKKEHEIFEYNGRFGSGYVVAYPSMRGTLFLDIDYFITESAKK